MKPPRRQAAPHGARIIFQTRVSNIAQGCILADMKPAVSVIVPVFSRADTIGRALESVLSQTFSDYEIVVVDDGSTDDTCRIIEQIQTDRLTLIRHASNRGPAAARNTAINASRGRWIAFLDSDDAWRPEKLERQVAILDKAAANIAACATGFCLHRDGRAFEVNQDIPPDRFRRDILFGCTISPGSTLMVDRAAFDKIGLFDEQMLRLEDWDWLLRFSEQFNIAFDPAPLADIYQADPTGRNSSGDPDAVLTPSGGSRRSISRDCRSPPGSVNCAARCWLRVPAFIIAAVSRYEPPDVSWHRFCFFRCATPPSSACFGDPEHLSYGQGARSCESLSTAVPQGFNPCHHSEHRFLTIRVDPPTFWDIARRRDFAPDSAAQGHAWP